MNVLKFTPWLVALATGIPMSAQNVVQDSIGEPQVLNEVVVRAEKPQIKGREGVLTIDLPAIVKDKPVTNVLESLIYLPGITKNGDNFSLAGGTGLTIIINGEVQNMPAENLYQLLASIPVGRLKNVEIMYAAPAKYHVKGAVVNVILKTPSVLDGLQGQLRAGYSQTRYASYSTGLSAIYATGRWSFDLNYGLLRSKTWNHEAIESRHTVNHTTHDIRQDSHRTGRGLKNTINVSAGYKFNRESRIRLTYNGQINPDATATNHTTGTFGQFINRNRHHGPIQFHNVAAYYKSESGFEISIDYTRYAERGMQKLFSETADAATVISGNTQRINRWHVYADRTHRAGSWELNYGVEYRYAHDRSRQSFTIPPQDGFDSSLKEHTANIYAGTAKSFTCGLSLSASIAGEYYRYLDEHSWNIIPQLGVTLCKTPASIFQLSFSSDREYPSYWEIHGGRGYLDSYSSVVGNPSLLPMMKYGGQFSYIFRQKYVATLFYHYKDRYSVQLPYQLPDKLQLIYQTVNFDFNTLAGVNIHAPFALGEGLNSTLTIQAYRNHVKAGHFHDISFDRKKFTAYLTMSNTFTFSRHIPVSLTVEAACISKSLQGLADMSALWRVDAGVKWTFARRNADLTLRFDDIFNSWSPKMAIKYKAQDYRMKIHDMSRLLKLTFTWRFNGFKPKDSEIDTSRFGTQK